MNSFPFAIDRFVEEQLPPRSQWPDFINVDRVAQQSSFNCAAELLDKAIEEGYSEKIAIYSPKSCNDQKPSCSHQKSNWSYQKLLETANQIARVLTEDLGLVPGNRVLLRSANNPMLAACWLATVKAGGIVVTTMAMLRSKELITVATQSQTCIALCDNSLKDEMFLAEQQLEQLASVVYFNNPDVPLDSLEAHMASKPTDFENYLPASSDQPALIGFTSGTTGKPKGAIHSHHAVIAVCETFSKQIVKPSTDDVFAGTPPLAFVYGLGGLLLFPLHARASTVMLEDVRPPALIDAIKQFGISTLFTAPTTYKALIETPDSDQLSSLHTGVSAGEALPAYVSQQWLDKVGIRLIDGIGSTELLHIFLSVQSNEDPIGTLGKAVPGYEAKVVDTDGKDISPGEIGYLAVRGPTGCRYLNDDRQISYVVDGWNVTGDSVKIDEEGYFWYQARTDGMIISSGYNIAAPEVEQAVSQHPAVAECGVIGIPDKARGNIVRAYVVLKDGYEPSDDLIKEIQDFTKQQCAPYKYPRSVKFIDALPRTTTGKIQHFALRELAHAEKAEADL